MKRITHFVLAGFLLCFLIFTAGCKTEPKTAEEPIPAASFKFMMVKHPVKDFSVWKPVYMAADSLRDAFGITKMVVARGTDDTTMVFVADQIKDLAKAKEFSTLPGLKAAMDAGGVTAPPTFAYAEMLRLDTTASGSNRVIVSHRVKDFDAWLKVYDADKSARAASGIADRALARDLDDPNTVYIVFIVVDREKANARMQSEELKKLMTDAGVEGPPSFFFYTVQN